MHHLIPAHGGELVDLLVAPERAAELRAGSRDWPSWDLLPHQVADLELLLNGGMSPLTGFMGRAAVASVCRDLRLPGGALWPVPVTLDVDRGLGDRLTAGDRLALRDGEGVVLAVLTVDEIWEADRAVETEALFGRSDPRDPPVARYLGRRPPVSLSGRLEGLQPPLHYDFRELRSSPLELRRLFARLGWRRVLAFQPHRVMHRAEQTQTQRAALELGANLLIHPAVGSSQPGDVDHYTRIRCYRALLTSYPREMARLALMPLAVRGGGPREALWHALVHRNHGCSHLLVEPNHGATVLETTATPGYDWQAARELAAPLSEELGIELVPWREMVCLEGRRQYVAVEEAPAGAATLRLEPSEVRRRLDDGLELPSWFTVGEVESELRHRHPARGRQGFTVFLTGLSGSGKSTIANALRVKLLELGGRGVTLLDGDLVRKNLSSELGFSKEHRDLNIRRIGFVAAEISRAGGAAICAPIAPYDRIRREVREMVRRCGGFVLVHVSTPLAVCEARDRKGMYAKARAGLIREFTGISDPYEAPADAEVVIDTSLLTPEEAVREVLLYLEREGFLTA